MNKIFTIFFSLTFLVGISSYAQEISIKISGAPKKAVLFELEGEKASKIDSVIAVNNTFSFSLKDEHPVFYRLQFYNKHTLLHPDMLKRPQKLIKKKLKKPLVL